MNKYIRKPKEVTARQVSAANIDAVARWCGGRIKGTRLAVEFREIEIWSGDTELRAEVGDWVAQDGEQFTVYTNDSFHAEFTQAFICSDFSAIEAVVLAELAGEEYYAAAKLKMTPKRESPFKDSEGVTICEHDTLAFSYLQHGPGYTGFEYSTGEVIFREGYGDLSWAVGGPAFSFFGSGKLLSELLVSTKVKVVKPL